MRLFRTALLSATVLLLGGCREDRTYPVLAEPQPRTETFAQGAPPGVVSPPGSTCVTIRRGGPGQGWDADIGQGNGNWASGGYPFTWTGPSPYDHWSIYKFDLSPVPAGSQIVLAAFTVYASWNDQSSTVKAHRITTNWDEATVTWPSFGGAASWDPVVLGSFNPVGLGYRTVDVTSLAQGWKSGVVANQGILLEEPPVKLHSYFASEVSDATLRPSLYVCYVAGGPCAGKANGASCDDGSACTTGESCQNGQCVGGAPKTCTAQDACHEAGVCNPASGVCSNPAKINGSPCNDGNACTTADFCLSGTCGGTPLSCDDGLGCSADSCSAGGCLHVVQCAPGQPCAQSFCSSPAGQDPANAWICGN